MKRTIRVVVALSAMATALSAASDSTFDHHEAHEHGVALLQVAIDGNHLEFAFVSPAVNIVGFEHEPRNDAQRQAISEAIALLEDSPRLFELSSAAGCQVVDAHASSSFSGGEHGEAHDESHVEEVAHSTADADADADADAEDLGHDDHRGEQNLHSEFLAHHRFECAAISDLTTISVNVQDAFPGVVELDVEMIGPRGQSAYTLSAGETEIRF